MEACFVNLVEPGDVAIVGVNGVFGERMCEVARRCGAEVVRVDEEWGRALDPQRLLDARRAHPEARLVAVVHAETSTGVENEIAPLVALRETETLLLVDAVTSLGGIPLEVDGWGIDAVYSGTQKCLGVPPGLAPLSFSGRAAERLRSRATPVQSWYLDLGLIGEYTGDRRAGTTTPRRSRWSTRSTPGSACSSKRGWRRRGRVTDVPVLRCTKRSRRWGSCCWPRRAGASLS